MRIIEGRAHARVGLLGNPSDGFFGKTIAAILRNFRAAVVVYEWPELEIILSREDRCEFDRLEDLVEDVKLNGLYGGLRLVKASIKKFAEYCMAASIELPRQNFSMRYETNIPRQVGLAGSSAIITAVFRALMEFYGVSIPREELPSLILGVETDEIGIRAGLQDRVAQVYEGVVYMDFEREHMEKHGRGRYEPIDASLVPPLYVAYRTDLSSISGVYHSNLRALWEQGDKKVVAAMSEFASYAEAGRQCLLEGDTAGLAALIDRNFDLRASITKLDPAGVAMVELARKHGVCAKYAGSGGAIVGICEDEDVFERMAADFATIGCEVIRPEPIWG